MTTPQELTSTIDLVRTRLREQIAAATVGLAEKGADVQVADGILATRRNPDEVQIGDIRDFKQEVRYSRGPDGKHKRDESYMLDIHVYVARNNTEDSNRQCWLIWSYIDDILSNRIDLQTQIPTLQVGLVREGWLNVQHDEARRGWRTHLLVSISVSAKIT